MSCRILLSPNDPGNSCIIDSEREFCTFLKGGRGEGGSKDPYVGNCRNTFFVPKRLSSPGYAAMRADKICLKKPTFLPITKSRRKDDLLSSGL